MISKTILNRKLLSRAIIPDILKWINDRQALILVGSRQVGKTSILILLIQHLIESSVQAENIFYLDLERLEHLELVESGPETVLEFLRLEGANFSGPVYLFIDEIQYLSDPSKFLKLMVDHYPIKRVIPNQSISIDHTPQIKVFCTGSSSLDIRRKFKDSLAGRKIIFEVLSLSFREFLQFKEKKPLLILREHFAITSFFDHSSPLNQRLSAIHMNALDSLLDEYCRYGGYPAVVLEPDVDKKIDLLGEIHSAYVLKDLSSLFSIENIHAFNQLIQILALGTSNLLNINTLTSEIEASRPTLTTYLTILEQTFIIKRLQPFFRRRKREVIKMPKVYFLDLGLRNLILKQFGPLQSRPDRGATIENFVLIQLIHRNSFLNEIHYWRAKHGPEVDFILMLQGKLISIEVKYQRMKKPVIPKSMRSFFQVYETDHAIIVNQNLIDRVAVDKTQITFLPAYLISYQ